MDAIQRDVALLFAAYMICQGGISDEPQRKRMGMPEDPKGSCKLDSQQQHRHAATESVKAGSASTMEIVSGHC